MKLVLEERGVNTRGLKQQGMIAKLSEFPDFKNERNKVARLLRRFKHNCIFLQKFHPELNPIERVWGKAKIHSRHHCDYTFVSLRRMDD